MDIHTEMDYGFVGSKMDKKEVKLIISMILKLESASIIIWMDLLS